MMNRECQTLFPPKECHEFGGQSGVAVTRSHGNDQDVGSNPAAARNEKTHIRQTPAQKVPQLCGRISVEDVKPN